MNWMDAIGAGLQLFILVLQTKNQKDTVLKERQLALLREWKEVHESNDIVAITNFLDRLRQQ